MKLRLLTKFLVRILFPVLVGLVVVAGLSYWNATYTVDQLVAEEMSLVVERQKSELSNIITQQGNGLRLVASRPEVRRVLAAVAAGLPEVEIEQHMAPARDVLQALIREFSFYMEVALVAPGGKVFLHTNPALNGKDVSASDAFRQAMQGRTGIQSLRNKPDDKTTTTTILALPLRNEANAVIGVLYANLNTPALAVATTNSVRFGKTGVCYVYDDNGIMIMHPKAEYIGDEDGENDWTSDILTKKNGQLRYIWDGKIKLAHFRAVPGTNWIAVLAVERAELQQPVVDMLRENALVVLMCSLIICLVIFVIARDISTPLVHSSRYVALVAQGNMDMPEDMRVHLESAGRRTDEIGALVTGIDTMVNTLRALLEEGRRKTAEAEKATDVARIASANAEARVQAENAKRESMLHAAGCLEEVVRVLSAASGELASQLEESERGAAEQAARITETATAMAQMNATVLEVARGASSAADVSAGARGKAEAGTTVVQQVVASIEAVQQQSVALRRDMEVLGENAGAISQIMNVISDIADQTNLLALNAAIEAARAGEAGRGFAVVADEVRKLAEKTMSSTTDVGNAIRAIQNSTRQSIVQMETAAKTIEEATGLASQSGSALKDIVFMVEQAADQVRAIATAAEEQSSSSDAISHSIGQINIIADETARTMRESAQTVSELARQSQVLSSLIADLKNE